MKMRSVVAAANIGFMFLLVVSTGSANAAEIKILSAEVMRHAINELTGEFERMTGHKLTRTYDSAGAVRKRFQDGEIADVVIIQKPAVEALSERGTIARESIVNLARSGLAMAVRKGASKPDISSVDAFKRSLLAAKSIAHPDPTRGTVSGVHVRRVIERLGITQEVNAKAKLTKPPLAEFVAQNEVEIVITQAADILAAPGLDLVGWLPDELQDYNEFTWTAGIPANAKEPDAAKVLIKFLTSPTAAAVIKKRGMEPASP